jgi:hypothetical protein
VVANNRITVIDGRSPNAITEAIHASAPIVLKGLVAHWPAVQAAQRSPEAADNYLRSFYTDATVNASYGSPENNGRVFYNEDLSGLNFVSRRVKLNVILDDIQSHQGKTSPPLRYVGSTTVDACLPGFRKENDLNLPDVTPLVSIWIGNQTCIPAHYDLPDNIACNIVGRRRFTLFPPEQLPNLYVGPLDMTPAGQAVSLVDLHNPDFKKYPKFETALESAIVAELAPGDAIFIPSMWWHHVDGLDPFNVLINYWWRKSPDHMGPPIDALLLALMTIRDLPEKQRKAWQDIFNYYVFDATDVNLSHIPESKRGVLAPMDRSNMRRLRSYLLNKLNR